MELGIQQGELAARNVNKLHNNGWPWHQKRTGQKQWPSGRFRTQTSRERVELVFLFLIENWAVVVVVVVVVVVSFVVCCCSLLSLLFFVVLCCCWGWCCSLLFFVVCCCSLLFVVVRCCSLLFFVVLCCSLLFFVVLCCSLLFLFFIVIVVALLIAFKWGEVWYDLTTILETP